MGSKLEGKYESTFDLYFHLEIPRDMKSSKTKHTAQMRKILVGLQITLAFSVLLTTRRYRMVIDEFNNGNKRVNCGGSINIRLVINSKNNISGE